MSSAKHPPAAAPKKPVEGKVEASVTPGRYAVRIERSVLFTHARQVVREVSTASLIVELDAKGGASAWRGLIYRSNNDGPVVHTEERLRERQGYRGHHRLHDGKLEIDLTADDGLVPPVHEGSPVAPRRSRALRLRCRPPSAAQPTLPGPALVCDWLAEEPPTREREAFAVAGLLPASKVVLGAGNGFRVRIARGVTDKADHTEVELLPAPLGPDDWER